MTPIQISNCPITGLERKITNYNLLIFQDVEQIILDCTVSHYKEGLLIENASIKTFKRKLTASDSYIRTDTGKVLTQQEVDDYNKIVSDIATFNERHAKWVIDHDLWLSLPEQFRRNEPIEPILGTAPAYNLMKEYDFYRFVLGVNPVYVFQMCEQIIALRDAEGKFNI